MFVANLYFDANDAVTPNTQDLDALARMSCWSRCLDLQDHRRAFHFTLIDSSRYHFDSIASFRNRIHQQLVKFFTKRTFENSATAFLFFEDHQDPSSSFDYGFPRRRRSRNNSNMSLPWRFATADDYVQGTIDRLNGTIPSPTVQTSLNIGKYYLTGSDLTAQQINAILKELVQRFPSTEFSRG